MNHVGVTIHSTSNAMSKEIPFFSSCLFSGIGRNADEKHIPHSSKHYAHSSPKLREKGQRLKVPEFVAKQSAKRRQLERASFVVLVKSDAI